MRIWIKSLLIMLLMTGPAISAQTIDLEKEHGSSLKNVPFVVRYKFQRDKAMNWDKATYATRKEFLEKWYADEKADKLKKAKEAKEQKAKDREKNEQKKAALRKEKNRKQKEKDLVKAEERQLKEEKKEFKQKVRDREQELKEMRRQQKEIRSQ